MEPTSRERSLATEPYWVTSVGLNRQIDALATAILKEHPLENTYVWGIPSNGTVIAGILGNRHGFQQAGIAGPLDSLRIWFPTNPDYRIIIVDDIVDTGLTMRKCMEGLRSNYTTKEIPALYTAAVYCKSYAPVHPHYCAVDCSTLSPPNPWIVFPWEREI